MDITLNLTLSTTQVEMDLDMQVPNLYTGQQRFVRAIDREKEVERRMLCVKHAQEQQLKQIEEIMHQEVYSGR